MRPEEVAAYIGAAAWLPQIITWLYNRFVQPVLTIVPDKYAEVGFTNFGPIFNLRIMFSTTHKGLIIDDFNLILRHTDGDTHTLRWAGLAETFSEITDDSGNRQVVGRDQTPIAIKVGTESLVEKFTRFQEPRFIDGDRPLTQKLVEHFHFLKQSDPTDYVQKTLASRELFAVVESRKNAFWWKAGRYYIEPKLSATEAFKNPNTRFYFTLSTADVERLRYNFAVIEDELKNIINSNLPSPTPVSINWNWANVDVSKEQ